MLRKIIAISCAAGVLAGCASSPDKISAQYVSPMQYASYDCDAVREEMIRVSNHVQQVAGVQRKKAKNDQIAMGVGLVLFWPALFFLAGGDKKEELSRLKGEYDALNQVAIQKRCAVADEIRAEEAKLKS